MASPSEDEELEDWPTTVSATSSAPTTPSSRRGGLSAASSDFEADADFDDYLGAGLPAPEAEPEPERGFATHTAFDAYFTHAAKPARTSASVWRKAARCSTAGRSPLECEPARCSRRAVP